MSLPSARNTHAAEVKTCSCGAFVVQFPGHFPHSITIIACVNAINRRAIHAHGRFLGTEGEAVTSCIGGRLAAFLPQSPQDRGAKSQFSQMNVFCECCNRCCVVAPVATGKLRKRRTAACRASHPRLLSDGVTASSQTPGSGAGPFASTACTREKALSLRLELWLQK